MRKLGLLLTLVTVLVLATAAPAVAAPGHAQEHSGNGMNREGGPGTHPGNAWKDPGQDQGSPANTADPDCTGNRTSGAQASNIGACEDATGAADKPGGRGGFDADHDWNNGCGNDTDFEDDNNGRCGGPQHTIAPPQQPTPHQPTTQHPTPQQPSTEQPCTETPPSHPPTSKPPSHPPTSNPPSHPPTTPPTSNPPSHPPSNPPTPPPGGDHPTGNPTPATPAAPPVFVGGPVTGPPQAPPVTPDVPVVVTVAGPVTPPPTTTTVTELPFTGPSHAMDLAALGMALIAVGTRLTRYERRRG